MANKYHRPIMKPIKPKGPGVMRPKPQDRYGQILKTKPIGNIHSGKLSKNEPSKK